MDKPSLLDDLQARLQRLIQESPAADVQRNLRAVLEQGLQRLDLVTRDELDTYVQVAGALRERVARLEARIDELERGSAANAKGTTEATGASGARGTSDTSGSSGGAGRGESPEYPGR